MPIIPTWIPLSILCAFIWAASNIADKHILGNWVNDPVVPLLIGGIFSLPLFLTIWLAHDLSPLGPIPLFSTILAGVLLAGVYLFYYRSVQLEEISRVTAFFYISPLPVLLLAWAFLGEKLGLWNYVGVAFLVAGAFLVSIKDLGSLSFGKATGPLALCVLCNAFSAILVKSALASADPLTVFAWMRLGVFLAILPIMALNWRHFKFMSANPKVTAALSINELANFSASLIFTFATALGPVTLVNALASAQSLFVFILATAGTLFWPKILKEELSPRTLAVKLAAILLIIAGAVLVS